ncbi:hypothetical protein DPMN_090125 [Dreissena polymorpha]|uniref:Uncharacterized protein n=2 Tax=Dreissena polymorpha TaxID=45954 RepID=A0A9D4KXN6_DREPO|nr:hypothetical protein DPMN_090125 [Dreissena polymorpha]
MEEHLTKRLEGLTVLIGLDENTSNLFNFFCNALYLGQWELARACVHILRKTNQKPVDFVQDIARQPFNRCVYSPSVPSACHLAWLSHLETQDTTTRDTHQDLAEFHFLLLEVCPYIADIHLKELYSYFKWLHTPMTSLTPGHMLTLSPGLLKFLQTLLTTHTRLAHNLITHITHTPSHGDLEPLTKNHRAIQFVYMNAVNGLLDSLTQSDLDEDLKHSHVGKIYDILALFDLPRDISPQLVKPVLSKLIEVANLWPGLLKNQAVMSVLVGQGDTCMLEEFCRLDYEAETNKAVETYQICAELSEEQRWLLHLLSLTDANCRWKMMLMFAVKTKRHVLEVIMETGLALIKCSMFNKLSALLEPPELHPLKPLLLLLGWTSCINSSEGRELLHTLWNKKSDSEHPAITMGCKKLAYQIDLIQWCVEKARPLMKEDVSGPRLSRSVDLFRGLESHSVLYVLNTSTRLSALDQGEVLQLLQKVPLTLQPEDKDKKRVKSVRFQEFEDPSPVSSTPDSDSPSLSLDQLKDMSIYTGFCALKNVMDAIWYCAQSPDVRLSRPVLLQGRHALSRRLMSGSSSESDRSRSNSEVSLPDDTNLGSNDVVINESPGVELNIHTLYAENVTSKLNAAKNYLAKLQPLTFRVEMLENVFSLLFVTHDDIQDILQASEYNSDEGDDSKSASGDVQTPVLTPIKELPSRGKTGVAKLQDNTNVTAAYDEPYVETPTGSHVDQPSIEADEKIDMNKVGKALENIKAHISKKRHKSSDDNWLDRRSSVSENISSLSASSSVNMDLIGFICSEYLVRDILAMLKDCILDVSAAKFHIHGNKTDSRDRYKPVREAVTKATVDLDPNIEEPLCHLVKSSVTMETLQKRITQLEKFTSEAHWRYQLVSDEHIPLAPGEVLSEVVMTTGGMSDDEVEIKDKKGSRRRRSSSSKNGKDAQELHAGRRPSQGRHSVSRVSVAKIPGGQSRSSSRQLVSTMLASPASLLTMSIRRGQTTQTRQIIKLFKLDATPEAVEVYFSQAMEKAVHAVQRSPGKDTQGQGVKVGLRGVAAAAAAGLANVTISDIADELLKSPHLPEIPVPLNVVSLPINIAQVLCKDNGPLIILLDLMLIATNSWEVCSHLMASITSKLAGHTVPVDSSTAAQDSRNASTKQRVSKIRTFPDIVSQLQKLLNLGIEEEIPSREHILLSRTFQRSLQHYLSHATLSLSAEKNKEYVILCQNLAMCISRTNDAFTLSKSKSPGSPESTAQSMVVDERERSRSRLSSGSRSRLGSAADRPVIHHCFKQLIHLMEKDVPASGLLAFVNK